MKYNEISKNNLSIAREVRECKLLNSFYILSIENKELFRCSNIALFHLDLRMYV